MPSHPLISKPKIGFIYPAILDKHNVPNPILNIYAVRKDLSLVMCAAFIGLDPTGSYMILMSLKSPSGVEMVSHNSKSLIPNDQIHPELRTTFLSAKMEFTVEESGEYTFHCELVSSPSDVIDSKRISFNIICRDE
ncbi:MAG: hypothetical protein E6556_21470 [Pantoea sp.]|nr:hypothetical protein [Pantoea sp.]